MFTTLRNGLRTQLARISPAVSRSHGESYTSADTEQLAGVGTWELDVITGDAWCSANFCSMLGLDASAGGVRESSFWALIHPDDRGPVRTFINAAIKQGEAYEQQARFLLHGNEERVFLIRGRPVVGAAGEARVIRYVGVIQDVTERARAEQELKESEARYRDLIENSRSLMCLHDLDGQLLWTNALPARLLGYSPKELIGRRLADLLDRDVRNQFDDYIERIRHDGHAEGLLRFVTRSGERRIWEYQNTLQTGVFSTPLVRGMAHDITDLKRTEKSLQTFRSLIDLSNDGFGVIDAKSQRIIDANDNLCSKLGYTREELLQLSIREIDAAFDAGEEARRPGGLTRESEYHRKDGSRFPVELNVSFARVGKDYFVTVVRDITERKRREQIMLRQEEQLRRLTAHLIDSHDRERRRVATALNEGTAQELFGVTLGLGQLRQAYDPNSTLGIVDRSQETLSRVIAQIRAVSNRLHPQLLDLAGLWAAISSYALDFGRRHGIQVRIELPDKMRRLPDSEEIAIFRVVQECLSIIHERSGSGQISLAVQENNRGIVISISDLVGTRRSPAQDNPEHELRLAEMMERARQFQGVIEMNTAGDVATKVRLSLPRMPRQNEANAVAC